MNMVQVSRDTRGYALWPVGVDITIKEGIWSDNAASTWVDVDCKVRAIDIDAYAAELLLGFELGIAQAITVTLNSDKLLVWGRTPVT